MPMDVESAWTTVDDRDYVPHPAEVYDTYVAKVCLRADSAIQSVSKCVHEWTGEHAKEHVETFGRARGGGPRPVLADMRVVIMQADRVAEGIPTTMKREEKTVTEDSGPDIGGGYVARNIEPSCKETETI